MSSEDKGNVKKRYLSTIDIVNIEDTQAMNVQNSLDVGSVAKHPFEMSRMPGYTII